jgi:membrane dipeptidase
MSFVDLRFWVSGILGCAVLALSAVSQDAPNADLVTRARALLDEVPLIDGHNDIPWQYRKRANNHLDQIDLSQDLTGLKPDLHTDIPRLRKGGVGGQFWSVYVPATMRGAEGIRMTLEQIDMTRRIVARYPETFELAFTADDITRIHDEGKIASLMGMEGGHSMGNSLAALRMLYEAGARYMTLTHGKHTDWADSCSQPPRVDGLTAFGREVVREMNRMGMMVDLSHVAPVTMHAALDVSEAPIIFSHSSARGVTDNVRNVPDDVLLRVKKNGGVVMVTFLSGYISNSYSEYFDRFKIARDGFREEFTLQPDKIEAAEKAWKAENPAPKNATLSDVADHIDHIRKVIGSDYIGLGGDYDGTTTLPDALKDVSTYPVLLAELLRRGYSEDEIKNIAGLNLLRVMGEVEQVAARLQTERPASDALITELDGKDAP